MSKEYSWVNLSYFNKAYKGLPFFHPRNLMNLNSTHKKRKDRIVKGWNNVDVWNLFDWFQKVFPEMLDELASNHVGYPMIDFEKTRKTGKREPLNYEDLSPDNFESAEEFEAAEKAKCKEWEDYLREIAEHIRNSDEEACLRKNTILEKHDGWVNKMTKEEKELYIQEEKKIQEYRQAEIEKALDMIKPIFFDLWD